MTNLEQPRTIITGGHFVLENGNPCLNQGTIESFAKAVDFAKKYYQHATLGVLVNDLGQVCGGTGCEINNKQNDFSRENFHLPREYLKILNEAGIPISSVIIIWEKYLRNRAKKLLKKKVKAQIDNLTFENGIYRYRDIPLTIPRKNDLYGTPNCALIMATLNQELEKMGFSENYNFYYIGSDNQKNISNPDNLGCGNRLSAFTNQNIQVQNFLIEADGTIKF